MRWWIVALVFAGLGVGFYKHYVTLDPLNLVVLAALFWTQWASMSRQQQIADLIQQAHKVSTQNQKALATKLDELKVEVKRSKG